MSSTIPYHPLIGIDKNLDEHPFEWPGKNPIDAAEHGAVRYGYIKVLSGDQRQKRGRNGTNMYHRKPLFTAPQAAARASTISDLLGLSAESFRESLNKRPLPVIESLRQRGFSFSLVKNGGGKISLLMTPLITCTVKESDKGAILDLVRENKASFIEALQVEAAIKHAPQAPEPEEPPDPLKGKKLQEIMAAMLPQMPTPFTVDHLSERLKAAGYLELAEQRTRLLSNIHYAISKGLAARAGYAKYRRVAPEPTQQPVIDTAVEQIAPPLDVSQPELDLTALVPTRDIIHVDAPAPPTRPEPPSAPTPSPEPAVAAPVLTMQTLAATVLDLASQAAASDDDTAALAAKLGDAFQQFENVMLEALTALTSASRPVIDQLNKRATAKQALLRSLTATQR